VKIFITSDTHFFHGNVIKYADRPFKDINHMNQVLVDNWNSVVSIEDCVLHLGDFAFGGKTSYQRITSALNGRIYLVQGNHDYSKRQIGEYFTNVLSTFVWNNRVFSHKPVREDFWKHNPEVVFNYHGHMHNKCVDDKRYINSSVEVTDYKPFLLVQNNGYDLLEILKGEKI